MVSTHQFDISFLAGSPLWGCPAMCATTGRWRRAVDWGSTRRVVSNLRIWVGRQWTRPSANIEQVFLRKRIPQSVLAGVLENVSFSCWGSSSFSSSSTSSPLLRYFQGISSSVNILLTSMHLCLGERSKKRSSYLLVSHSFRDFQSYLSLDRHWSGEYHNLYITLIINLSSS